MDDLIDRPHMPAVLCGLRVALVHDWLTGRRGGEKCLEVLCRVFPEARLYTLLHKRGAAGAVIERMDIRTSFLQGVPGIDQRYRSLLPLMPLAVAGWRIEDVDLVVSFSHCVAKAVRVPPGVPHVCYCFTPMRYAWDGRDAYLDGWRDRPIRRVLASRLLDALRAWDYGSARGVTQFVAISETVRGRIARAYGRESVVIQPPVDAAYYRPADRSREDFYLVVSALVPYKRLDHAIVACRESKRRLIVIGAGPERARLERLAGPETQMLGWQSDEVIRDHLQRCRALLFPGVEDFGIVPIEALACGTPVIAFGEGGAAETVDNLVGAIYTEPTPEALRTCIDDWERAGRPCDPTLARTRAEHFDLPRFEHRLLRLLAEVVHQGGDDGAREARTSRRQHRHHREQSAPRGPWVGSQTRKPGSRRIG